jgi:hypothetical protein
MKRMFGRLGVAAAEAGATREVVMPSANTIVMNPCRRFMARL